MRYFDYGTGYSTNEVSDFHSVYVKQLFVILWLSKHDLLF